ncbi:MAG TPA: non-canonical purine NTP pyrophosphatase [Thermoplasmata archaeon]|nr:non-canonical purine NTP pyrophosphatase [Thermoplasmata archaeon]
MTDLTFVSTNPGKFREVHDLLAPQGVRVRWRRRTLPEPQAETLEEVVAAKLAAVRDIRGYVLVEDSGLFVPSLHGFPGVYSAHFLKAWKFGPLLELLEHRDRAAYFETVAGLQRGARRWTFVGRVDGSIAPRPRGRNGFGYDPVFVPAGHHETFGELAPDVKNTLSHRARAVELVGKFLNARRRR